MHNFAQKIGLSAALFFFTALSAQAQFFLNGNAVAINDSCYQLTMAANSQVGSLWNGELVDLNESFEVLVDIFVGCEDELGADGMVFGLQPVSTSIGVSGGDIGFGNVQPSLGVEIDTYQNLDYNDPAADHLAIVRDGILNHNVATALLAGPVQASATEENIEDCTYHPLRVIWDADTQTLTVYLDCELRLTYTADIVNEIFGGDPLVYWGFTSATGGLNNVHEVCFSYTSFLDQLVDQTTCPGQGVQLEASGGVSYLWSPTEGLSDPTIANPIATPTATTLYSVEITDDCGITFFDDVLITVENDQFDLNVVVAPNTSGGFPAGFELQLSGVVSPAESEYTYEWSTSSGGTILSPTDSTTAVMTSLTQTGTEVYTLLVTNENGCSEEISVSIENLGIMYEIPNIFSPNGDGTNDGFGLFTVAGIVSDYSCKVFNRWGNLVFETDSPVQFWDGRYDNKPAPSDVYVYSMDFSIGGMRFEEDGELTLVR